MRTTILVEDGVLQVVLSPESVHERRIIEAFYGKHPTVRFFEGCFAENRGGWLMRYENERSLIIRLDVEKPPASEGSAQ